MEVEVVMAVSQEELDLGARHYQAGQFEQAAQVFRWMVQSSPDCAEVWNWLGAACVPLGRLDEAAASFERAVALKPDWAEARSNLGVVRTEQGRIDEAVACFREAVRLAPGYAEAHNNLGNALWRRREAEAAAASYEEALRLKPDYPDAHYNLGIVLGDRGRLAEAVAHYEQALTFRPDHAEALNNLANALQGLRRYDEALACHDRAVRLRPRSAAFLSNKGITLAALGRYDEARACHEAAMQLQPDYAEAYNNLGVALNNQGKIAEALPYYERATELKPDHAEAHKNRATALLTLGRYEEGWPAYEWRFACKSFAPRPNLAQPLWDGSPLEGRTILLYAEQGLGDTIQFVRFAPRARDRGGRVILACQPGLVPLLRTCPGIDCVVPSDVEVPPFDVHLPLMSLPAVLGTSLATLPAEVPYLFPDPQRVERWRRTLDALPGFKVGIVWQGSPSFKADQHRSVALERFEPLARVPGVRLICLQKGHGAEQLAALNGRFEVLDLGPELDASGGAFLDTAAVMRLLDLVVTSDTAAAHLAGALGVPVWVALSASPDWRWMVDREDYPWYPTMRLFRQATRGEWPEVFDRMAEELRRRVGESAPRLSRPIVVEVSPGELLDKLTILEIKGERIGDPARRANVRREYDLLAAARDAALEVNGAIAELVAELKTINESLWEVEDALRACERDGDFGDRFIELARSVYRLNDRRSALKRTLNERLGSSLIEEKSYGSDPDPSQSGERPSAVSRPEGNRQG